MPTEYSTEDRSVHVHEEPPEAGAGERATRKDARQQGREQCLSPPASLEASASRALRGALGVAGPQTGEQLFLGLNAALAPPEK